MQENVNTIQAATHSDWRWIPTSKELLEHAEEDMLKGNENLTLCWLVKFYCIKYSL